MNIHTKHIPFFITSILSCNVNKMFAKLCFWYARYEVLKTSCRPLDAQFVFLLHSGRSSHQNHAILVAKKIGVFRLSAISESPILTDGSETQLPLFFNQSCCLFTATSLSSIVVHQKQQKLIVTKTPKLALHLHLHRTAHAGACWVKLH